MDTVISMSAADREAERPSSASDDVHFTEAFARTFIEKFSGAGDVVLDPFAGYGTTLVVSQQLDREPIGIELDPDRVAIIRERVGSGVLVIEGDAREMDRYDIGPVDLCLTSPPYMSAVDHPQNPLTGYTTLDGHYPTYRQELLGVFLAVERRLRPGGHLVINAATIRTGDTVTPLGWDIVHDLSPHMSFRGETYLHWDRPLPFVSGDYCFAFQKQ